MKAFVISKLKVIAGILVYELIVAALVYFIVLPVLVPAPGADPGAFAGLNLYYALILFLVGASGSVVAVLAIMFFSYNEKYFQELADSIRMPAMIVDAENRYALLNREAERVVNLRRDRDIGKSADPRIVNAISNGNANPELLNPRAVVEFGQRHFQVVDNPLPDRGAVAGGRQRVVMLRDVTNQMRIKETIRELNQTMRVLNANTIKISNSAVSLSQGATEQATSLTAITSSMSEFSRKIQGSSESAAKGTQLAAQAREAAERSGGEIANALSAMTDVQDAGIRIARIVKLIDDIAFQTNLLALNAAVEAARAGRQGKGFAVVADEVRNLAGRSAKAAKDTASMVEDVTERIGNASAYISKLEEMLRNIMQDAIRMADSSASASATSSEQATGILHVNQELGQMNSVTQSTMSAAEQTATAVEILTRQVETLKRKLDELTKEFALQNEDDPYAKHGPGINLLDEPAAFGDRSRTHSYLDGNDFRDSDGGFSSGEDRGSDWDLAAELGESTSSLASLLRPSVHEQGYESYPTKRGTSEGIFSEALNGRGQFTKTADGDRIVKPNQNILLDDSEFGRY